MFSESCIFFETKKRVGRSKMDKNFCPFFVFREKNLEKKSTIFISKHNRAKYKKNNFCRHCDVFHPILKEGGRGKISCPFPPLGIKICLPSSFWQ